MCTFVDGHLQRRGEELATAKETAGDSRSRRGTQRGVLRNVVHVVVDDLRTEIGCYMNDTSMNTPNLDRLASGSGSMIFDRAYCQQSVCGPSRNSFMTGRYPDRSRTWNFINSFREDHPEWTTLPGVFLANGALALGSGKLFHPKMPAAYDGEKSWSRFHFNLPFKNPCWNTADFSQSKSCEAETPADAKCDGGLPCAFCPVDIESRLPFLHVPVNVGNEYCEIDAYEDTLTIDHAISLLRQAKTDGRQFYLGVGLHKPHMPWQASASDFAKHPMNNIDLPQNRYPPRNVPPIALHSSDGSLSNHTSPYVPASDKDTRVARRAYRAAVTGMDRKLGRLLDELTELDLEESTAIVLHGDRKFT